MNVIMSNKLMVSSDDKEEIMTIINFKNNFSFRLGNDLSAKEYLKYIK